ncbi:MAG: prephenate dehydratase [Micromonosporaceae bacterium]|nr:prephenate dehydratase [Micromonosporaceae bacterium]
MRGLPLTRFSYLGPEGTFAEQALRTIPAAERGTRLPARSVAEALDAVRAGEVDAALVPMENSIGGVVAETLDELTSGGPLVIIREVVIPVQFVLAARSAIDLAAVRTVAAHPQASTQCRGWLRAHLPDAAVVDVLSNGAAAVGAAQGEYDAAICAPIGAHRHALTVLADKIADHPDAVTRFVLVTRAGRGRDGGGFSVPEPTGEDITTLAVYIAHDRVGALLSVLMELAVRGVNLTSIQSRPTGEQLGRYAFFLDCEGHVAEARLGEALQGLRRICADVRFLGSYPRHRWRTAGAAAQGATAPPPGLSNADFAESAAWLARLRSGDLS